MATHIVVINNIHYNARMACEHIEDTIFKNQEELLSTLKEELDSLEHLQIFKLTDFMDAVNDQVLEDFSCSYISYVKIEE